MFKFGRNTINFSKVKPGDIFQYNGDRIKCIPTSVCRDGVLKNNVCIFHKDGNCTDLAVDCTSERFDGKSVAFIKIN